MRTGKTKNCRGKALGAQTSCLLHRSLPHQHAGKMPALPASRPLFALTLLAILFVAPVCTFAQRRAAPPPSKSASLSITTEPNAIVWIDEIRRGMTGASGQLELNKVSAGRHTLRVRAIGFKEVAIPLVGGRRSVAVKVRSVIEQVRRDAAGQEIIP